jgi:hypothetical protein
MTVQLSENAARTSSTSARGRRRSDSGFPDPQRGAQAGALGSPRRDGNVALSELEVSAIAHDEALPFWTRWPWPLCSGCSWSRGCGGRLRRPLGRVRMARRARAADGRERCLSPAQASTFAHQGFGMLPTVPAALRTAVATRGDLARHPHGHAGGRP